MLDGLVTALVQAGVPGAAACLADGDAEWVVAAGDAGSDTRFVVGSVTKMFVAAVALRVGIDLDAPARRWAELAPPDVTVRMLMDHSSGIADYMRAPNLDRARTWSPGELVALAGDERAASWQYSNTNAILLALVVEAATGKSLDAALRELVLEPLGLHATTPPPAGSFSWAAGALESTPRDVSQFLGALLGGNFVDTTDLRRTVGGDGEEFARYGAGIAVMTSILGFVPSPCGPAWGHLGLGFASSTAALSTPDGRRRLVVCTNGALDEAGWRVLGEHVWPILCNTATAA